VKETSFSVLIVDDEPNIRSGLAQGLRDEADFISQADGSREAIEKLSQRDYQLVIADIRLNSELSGIELLKYIVKHHPQCSVVLITAHGSVETAVEAMRAGAFDFILKPLDLNLVREQVRKAREYHRLRIENQELKTLLADAGQINDIIGNSAAMQDIFRQIRQVADTEATVLIQGESGTGKELVARALHELSGRSSGPFVAVHLGALPDTLLESELFGHEKGSFSGASRRKPGCFEQAASGTLFLDEVTEMSPKSQVDLLRVLESRQFRRVGGEEVLTTDIRLVAATNRNVQDLIQEGIFREDLYYRLNVIPLEVPPLRSRREDIPLLIEHFMTYFCQRHSRPVKHVSATAMDLLTNAPWPGNIRQLRNLVERLVVTHNGEMIQESDIPRDLAPSQQVINTLPGSLNEAVEAFEKETIAAFLNANGMHREKTAKALGVSVRTLHYKMSRYGLH
jgi:two-component system NtrC family response regulator